MVAAVVVLAGRVKGVLAALPVLTATKRTYVFVAVFIFFAVAEMGEVTEAAQDCVLLELLEAQPV